MKAVSRGANVALVLALLLSTFVFSAAAKPSPTPGDADAAAWAGDSLAASLSEAIQAQGPTAKIEDDLLEAFSEQGSANFFVVMAEKADLAPAYQMADWSERGRYVYDALRETAARTQAPVIEYAKEHDLVYRSFLTVNSVYIQRGTLEVAEDLAALPGVEALRLEGEATIEPIDEIGVAPTAYGWNLDTLDPAADLYGMQAVQVWDTYGVHGEGIVVANIDTGAYYQHEALVEQYRGNLGGGTFDHDFNWYMPTYGCGDGTYPCDNHGHGSGTIGLMAGQTPDLVEQIGIAPAATWIACKGCESSSCSDAALTACADWMVAPCPIGVDPGDPQCDSDMRPHIVNNSWGGPGCNDWYQGYVQAWVASGIFPAFSAGNTDACGAVGSPGDLPESFGTAAHTLQALDPYGNPSGTNLYAGGPSCYFPNPSCDPDAHQVDPHVNAPSYGRTSGNDPGEYYLLSGTSGASPHTAGTVALIWSANPAYVGDIPGTMTLLEQSANPNVPAGTCGEPACAVNHVPNYEYGWGYLDAFAAVTMAGVGEAGVLEGTITEAAPPAAPGDPLQDITVTAERAGGGFYETMSDPTGYYSLTMASGTYTVTAAGPEHTAQTVTGVEVITDTITTLDFQLVPKGMLYGYVTDADSGAGLAATVTADGTMVETDPPTGYYEMFLDAGIYDVTAEATDYASQTVTVEIFAGVPLQQDFALLAAVAVVPDPIEVTLELGQTASASSVMTNNMVVDYPFHFIELGQPGAMHVNLNPVLLMGEDVDAAGWQAYRDALTVAGVAWDEWDLNGLPFPTLGDLDPYAVLVWFDESSLTPGDADCQVVVDWLNSGGRNLFATSVDFLWDLENGTPGLGEYNLYQLFATEFLGDYAGSTIPTMEGIPGDPIGGDFAPPDVLALSATADSNGDYADEATSVADIGLLYGVGGSGSGHAGLSHYDAGTYKTVWLGVNFHNGLADPAQRGVLMTNVMGMFLGVDVPWYGTDILSGTVPSGGSLSWTNFFTATPAAGVEQPGDYFATLRIAPDQGGDLPTKDIGIIMTVLPTAEMGLLEGTVTSNRPGGPLEAEVLIEATGGMTWTVVTDPDGTYSIWLDEGTYDVTASSPGYVDGTAQVVIVGGGTTVQDFELALDAPWIAVSPASMAQTLGLGEAATQTLAIGNDGLQPLDFEIKERGGDMLPMVTAGEDVLVVYDSGADAADAFELGLDNLGHSWLEVTAATFVALPVDELLTYDAVIYVGYPSAGSEQDQIIAFLDAGGSFLVSDNDFGYFQGGSVLYQEYLQATYVSDSGSDGTLIGLDIMAGINPDISADPYPDDFTGGPEGVGIFEAPSGNLAGIRVERLDYRAIYFAWDYNYIGNSAPGDPDETTVLAAALGWLIYDVPWLSEDPITGTVPAGMAIDVEVTFDAGEVMEPGDYAAELRIQHNDPLQAIVVVPITLTVLPGGDIGRLEGTVTGLGYCDAESYPLEAELLIQASSGMTWTTTSDPGTGFYYHWLDAGTYTVTVSAPEHVTGEAVVEVTAGMTTTQDFGLRLIVSCMDVTPLSYSVELPPDTVLTDTLSIANAGARQLVWEVRETTATMKLVDETVVVNVPAVEARPDVAARGGAAPAARPARQFEMHIGWVSQEEINVLIVTPDVVGGGDISLLLNTLAAFPDLNVTVWDGNAGTPSVPDMQAFNVVFVGNDILWSSSAIDKTTLSNNLADYIDAGGKVLAGSFIWSYDDWGLGGGRFITEDYSPYEIATMDIWNPTTLGAFDPDHPVMAGITTVTDGFNHQDPALSSNGSWIASWADGEYFVAESPNCVGLNQEYFYNAVFGGQVGELLHNALLYLAAPPAQWVDVPWVTEVPTAGVTLPDSSYDVDVVFDSTGLETGTCYTASLGLLHDDPGWENPLMIPLELCVVACAEVTEVDLVQVTAGDIYPGDPVEFSADIMPDTATKPYSYTIDFGDGTMVNGASSDDPLLFDHTYTTAGTYTVTIAVWNCAMEVPVTDTVVVLVQSRMSTIYLPVALKNY